MAYLKMEEFKNAIDDASKALELKPGYVKAHYRRGKAYIGLNRHVEAIQDFQLIVQKEPENKMFRTELENAIALHNS